MGMTAAAHFQRGLALYQEGDHRRAIDEFTQAIELEPDVAGGYQARGLARARVGEAEQAVEDFERAVALCDPAAELELAVEAHFNCGHAYEGLGRYPEALRHYDAAIELHPAHGSAWCNRGNVLLQQGEFERAAESHTRAIELNPSDFRAYWGRAIANYQLSRLDLVPADLRKFLEIAPSGHEHRETARRALAQLE
ncbi:MAG: tetratricopeptide repeat protein [Gaiellaceae bacterium]